MSGNRIEQLPTRLLARAYARSQSIRIEAYAEAGTTGYQARLLASLADEGSASQAELGRRTAIDPSDVVAAVNQLTDRGFALRARDPQDARCNIISVTRAGEQELARLEKIASAVQDRVLAPLTAAQRTQLSGLLSKLAEQPR
ncbi:winged helix-turn-helix transcriptional regulator [Nocardioides humilatus]|uniref:Winged helix-turn-helix transcriptional regulator n=1 Tax=Nocardioides humilatus TaxID=2607660 RepID=A0A5B1LJP5_9ACTN|nr:MarR family winged helix-turn-helix transcriptional regulator [Nocardioides humilatus]KAA1420955.1 winged helix-turn-helix transcriptional regulator [Nocardioides humilatus]